jgi:uncharacterized RDD family membrane protein YckC
MASLHSPSSSRLRARRVCAATIDTAIGLGLALLLSQTMGMYFARRAVVMLHIGEPDTWWQGPIPLMLGVVGEVTYLLPFALWIAWLLDPLSGATLGKRLVGLRIVDTDGAAADRTMIWRHHLTGTCGLWGLSLALVTGSWQLAVVASIALLVVGLGALLLFGQDGRTLHDRVSGTMVA